LSFSHAELPTLYDIHSFPTRRSSDLCYFKWYEKAVESELKIAQLYEYYMAAARPDQFHKPLPRSVYLYFMHGNSLDYHKCAFLRSEEHTSELQSRFDLVCRLLLEKKK